MDNIAIYDINHIKNKIICADCSSILPRLPDNCFDLVIADPPYLTTGEKWDQEEIFSSKLVEELYRVLKDTGSIYVWCGIGEKSQSLIRWFPLLKEYFYFKDLITWKKQRGIGMRKGWLYTREEILWFAKDNKSFIWNKENQYSTSDKRAFTISKWKGKMKGGEYKRLTNVWDDIMEYQMGTSPQKGSDRKLQIQHHTPKPLEAMERIILLHTNSESIILDPFIGSGTTGVACKNLNRSFVGIEINKEYCKLARERIDA